MCWGYLWLRQEAVVCLCESALSSKGMEIGDEQRVIHDGA